MYNANRGWSGIYTGKQLTGAHSTHLTYKPIIWQCRKVIPCYRRVGENKAKVPP